MYFLLGMFMMYEMSVLPLILIWVVLYVHVCMWGFTMNKVLVLGVDGHV